VELRAVRKIRLRYSESDFHAGLITLRVQDLSHFAACDQNPRRRAGSSPMAGIESQICILKGYYVSFFSFCFLSCIENPGTPRALDAYA
jgi:hypothetical protein